MVDIFGNPVRIVKRAAVENMRLESDFTNQVWGIFSQGGSFECDVRNLWVEGSTFMSNQGITRATIENIRGRVSRKAFDVAYFSHSSYFQNIRLSRINESPQTETASLFACVEGAHDNVFVNSIYDNGNIVNEHGAKIISGARRNRFVGVDIMARNLSANYNVAKLEHPGIPGQENTFTGCRFFASDSQNDAVYVDGAGSDGNEFDGCEVIGSPGAGIHLGSGSSDNQVRGCKMSETIIKDDGTNNRIEANKTKHSQNPLNISAFLSKTATNWNTAYTYTIPGGSAAKGASWHIYAWGDTATSSGNKQARLFFGPAGWPETVTLPDTVTGFWAIECEVGVNDFATSSTLVTKIYVGDTMTQTFKVLGVDLTTTDMTIELQTQVDSGAMRVRGFRVTPYGDQRG
jgi:hypothetical protein